MFRLEGRRALVTGGTAGIGEGIAAVLLRAGARVVVAGRDETRGAAARERLQQHGEVHFHAADVTDEEAVQRLVTRTVEALGGLDVLVNNAGTIRYVPLHAMAREEWAQTIETNLTSIYLCTRAALPHLRRSRGAIVNVSSNLAFRAGHALAPAYNAAKAGVLALTQVLAVNYGPDGVRVNAVCPGLVPTELNRPRWGRWSEEEWARVRESYPLRRAGTPEDVGYAVLFLVSAEAGWITGTSLVVDGGLTAR
jgi:NAD(P)-dependent dehydrogenase (short-subunit alcohol dehydrogenase family)